MLKSSKNYQLKPTVKILKDAASVKFHVENNDYFGTAATLVALIRQQLSIQIKKAPVKDRDLIDKAFKNLENDLLHLQDNYQIKANQKKNQKEAKGRLKSQ